MCINILLLLLLLSLIISVEGYQNNTPPPDRPDELQFISCHDFSNNENYGNNNYLLRRNRLDTPLTGNYSSFLDIYGIRNYDEFFHSPICQQQEQYNFERIGNLEFREIADTVGADELLSIDDVYNEEIELDESTIRDPNYVYVNPQYIANTLLYNKEINDTFLRNHRSHDAENLLHRLDPVIYR